MSMAWIFSVDKDVIKIYDDENIELFYQDLVDLTLGHWIIQTASPDTQNNYIWFEKLSSTYHLPWSLFSGKH